MIPGLEPIGLRDLRALDAPRRWEVDGYLDQLQSLTPVRGIVEAEHRGNVLAVEGDLSTIVTLTCDRCLGQFNLELSSRPSELIWLGTTPPTDEQLQESEDIEAIDGLVESLDPRGSFNPEQWAFEQLNLNWRDHVLVDQNLFRPSDLIISAADPSKANNVLGWKAHFKLTDIVREMLFSEQLSINLN